MAPPNVNTLWLIRQASGMILGPVNTLELKKILVKTKQYPDTEICPQNSYWFNIVDTDELKKHFNAEDVIKILHMTGDSSGDSGPDSTRSDIEATRPAVPIEQTQEKRPQQYVQQPIFSKQTFASVFFIGVVLSIFALVFLLKKLNT